MAAIAFGIDTQPTQLSFGTQDEDGRNKLVEAITAVQEDFDLILIITHLDDLRDSFPVHIMLDKTNEGSRVSVR